ncbi:MAG: hypothetical protein F4027_14565 [Rhodospirillaceae bacterium]|nr:hypothetical protein [Rhodospirillaceae bacterium]MYK59753.1 hypothetical protein [Rhodospirillaceae bacterium]
MPPATRHTLTVDLIDIAALDPRGVAVSVELEKPRLVYPVGDPPGTVYPSKLEGRTDSRGVADLAAKIALKGEADRVATAAASAPSAIKIARGRAGYIARTEKQEVFAKFFPKEPA